MQQHKEFKEWIFFREVAEKKRNVAFDKAKGNLFEYIEEAKFNTEAAKQASALKAVVTDSVGRPRDTADIEIMKDGAVVRQVQAKFSDSQNAAADSVFMQKRDNIPECRDLSAKKIIMWTKRLERVRHF